jgi:glyoxylase I family protein
VPGPPLDIIRDLGISDDLERAASALDGVGIKHGEVKDLADAGIAILSFQNPDDINVELTAALG